MNLRFPSGIVAEIQASWLSPVKLRRTIVVGSKKMLIYDDTENVEKVKLFDHGVDFQEPTDFGEFQLSYRTGDIVSPKVLGTEPLVSSRPGHFVNCVRTGAQPLTDGWAGLRVVASLEAAQASLDGGGRRARSSSSLNPVGDSVHPDPDSHYPLGVMLYPNVSLERIATCNRRASSGNLRGEQQRASARSVIGAGATSVLSPPSTQATHSALGLQTGQACRIREDNVLGDDVSIGTSAVWSSATRRQSGSHPLRHVLEYVTIEDDVFVGPNMSSRTTRIR